MTLKLILPLLPVIGFYLFIFLYNKKHGRSLAWKGQVASKIGNGFLILLLVWLGSNLIIDPNYYMETNRSNSIYTSGRQLGVFLLFIGYIVTHSDFLSIKNMRCTHQTNHSNLFWKGAMFFYFIACITAILSGAYGFLTRTCWGLFEIKFISDTFLWWAELGWSIAGLVGIWVYFRNMRHWNEKDFA